MSGPPALPRILVCYERGDADAYAERLVADLRRVSHPDNVATWYAYGPNYLQQLLYAPNRPLLIIALAGPAFARPRQAETPEHRELLARSSLIQLSTQEQYGRHIVTLLVGGAAAAYARLPPEQQRGLDPRHPPIEIRDEHWQEDLDERLLRHLWAGFLERPDDDAGRGAERRPTAEELEYAVIRHYEHIRATQQSVKAMRMEARRELALDELWRQAVEGWRATNVAAEDSGAEEALPTGALSHRRGEEMPPPAPPSPAPPQPAPPRGLPTERGGRGTGGAQQTPPASDVVECTVFAPPGVRPGAAFLLQVFAHLTHEDEAVARLAKEADEEAEKRGSKSLDSEVARGSRLTFHLRLPGMRIDDPVQHLTWRGEPEAVQFGVTAGDSPASVIGTVTVSQNDVPFGHVKFKLTVAAETAADDRAEQAWARYRKAFISYASQDRDEVLKRVQMLARVRVEFFQDLLSLEPGQRWERELYRHIDESDVFFLFWSKAAKDSEWVMREIRYALARRAGDETKPPEILPVIIEGPPLVEPPPELADLHFNDQFLYFINREGAAR